VKATITAGIADSTGPIVGNASSKPARIARGKAFGMPIRERAK